jgi:hypothetical protein
VGCYPATAGERTADRSSDPPIAGFDQPRYRFSVGYRIKKRAANFVWICYKLCDLVAVPEKLFERAAGFHHIGG